MPKLITFRSVDPLHNPFFTDTLLVSNNDNLTPVAKITNVNSINHKIRRCVKLITVSASHFDRIPLTADASGDYDDVYDDLPKLLFVNNTSNDATVAFANYTEHTVIVSGTKFEEVSPISALKCAVKEDSMTYVFTDEPDKYRPYLLAAMTIKSLCNKTYNHIIVYDKEHKPELIDLPEFIARLNDEERDDIINQLANLRFSEIPDIERVLEQMFNTYKAAFGVDLITQESQISTFLDYANLTRNNQTELVPDHMINRIEKSDAYKLTLEKLKQAGFGISKTQQFNALQAAGYYGLSRYNRSLVSNSNTFFNLSDMGAGKTLMTVESLFLLDIAQFDASVIDKDKTLNGIDHTIELTPKNIIAPKLSIKSSWLDTFKIFYDVKKIDESTYELSLNYKGHRLISRLSLAPFTVSNTGVKVSAKLPFNKLTISNDNDYREYLIIDEIHQLSNYHLTANKFFAKGQNVSLYDMFILSGTLSDLTTVQWYNLIKLLNLKISTKDFNNIFDIPTSDIVDKLDSSKGNLRANIRNATQNLLERNLKLENKHNILSLYEPSSKHTPYGTQFYHQLYSPKLIQTENAQVPDLNDLLTDSRSMHFAYNFDKISAPNFELFYQLVGLHAVTAESQTIATELFGKQKMQHKAQVIKSENPLSDGDIAILKVIHSLAKDYTTYKSRAIASNLNNAILNLNDGLQTKSLYDIVNTSAQNNMRFLKHLSSQSLDVLQKLPESSLIQTPKLEDTPKFKILTDLLDKEKDNTILIVVNDENAMKKLAKALNLKCFTHSQLHDPISYQDILDDMFEKQNVVIVPQFMIKSSLDLVQANRLIQYQLNENISDIIQTQNRINRVGQTRETKAYYLATDKLQENIINLFLETYRNIRVAHKGIVELFVDPEKQVNVVNDYVAKAMEKL